MNQMLRILSMSVAFLLLGMMGNVVFVVAQAAAEGDGSEGGKAPASKAVAKIVFVDKEECCQCTGERIDKSWKALQAALKEKSASIQVDRIHEDTQSDKTAKFKALKAMVTVPALYFLDADGNLVNMIQGEVTQEQIQKLL